MNIKGLVIYLLFITASFFVSMLVLFNDLRFMVFYPLVLLVAITYYTLVYREVYWDC